MDKVNDEEIIQENLTNALYATQDTTSIYFIIIKINNIFLGAEGKLTEVMKIIINKVILQFCRSM